MIRKGFWGFLNIFKYNIPPNLILIIKAPILGRPGVFKGVSKWGHSSFCVQMGRVGFFFQGGLQGFDKPEGFNLVG